VEVFVNQSGGFGYIDGLGALVKTGTGTSSGAGATTTSSLVKVSGGNADVAFWGEVNDFPQLVVADAEMNTSLATMLNWKAKAWYGGGLVYGTLEFDEQGEEVFKRVKLPAVEEFIRRSNLKRFGMEALMDISWFGQAFPELILSRDRKQIVSVSTQDACYCRYARAKSATDIMRKLYINANWANGGRFDDEYTTTVPVLDPYYDAVEGLRARTDGFKYIYPISFPSPDKSEYQLASWNTVRRSGWLDMAKAVVEFKKNVLKQILSVEWVIEVNPAYWAWKYKDWEEKDEAERRRLITLELKGFGDVMTGSNGAGKSLMTTTVTNSKGEEVAAFKITALDKKMREGLFNEDSQEAASHVFTAGGVAPTLMGIQPGKNMGAGSGSDARVAFNNFISTSTFEQDLVLEVLHFIRDYNGWPENLEFRFKQPLIMTMDKGKQVQQQTA
jgi:hypothetical protein